MIYLNRALLENTDLTEYEILQLSEESKSEKADKIITRMYKSIKSKAGKASIPEVASSAGDVNKFKGYKDVIESINCLEKLSDKSSNHDLKQLVADLKDCDKFLTTYKKYFVMGYSKNNLILKSCYEGVLAMMVQLTVYATVNCVTFVKTGVMYEAKATPSSPKLRSHYGYKSLKKILDLMHKNKLEKNFKDCLSLNEAFSLSWLGITLLLLTSIRSILYMSLLARVKLAEYLDSAKNYVELNQANVRDPQIKAKQQKWIARLEKMRDRISVDQEVASSRAEEDIATEDAENFTIDNAEENDLGLI